MTLGTGLILLILLLGFGLSLWIIIPAPLFSLLPLSVGTPELSPWLTAINSLGLLLLLCSKALGYAPGLQSRPIFGLLLLVSAIALSLSTSPLLRFATAQQKAETALVQALGADYAEKIDPVIRGRLRSQPFNLFDAFRRISIPPVREDRAIPFAQPDGVSLRLNLYRPQEPAPSPDGRYPAIIAIHGGAWREGGSDNDAKFNRYMAAQGYAVWAISYRHAPEHHFPAQLEDVQVALQFIQAQAEHYETDTSRMALVGRSAGAQLASLASYQPGSLPIRALVNYYGPVDLVAGYRNLPTPDPIDSRSVLEAFLGGTPEEKPELYHQASPIHAVLPGLPPSLLIYGQRDHIVKAEYGQVLAQRLQATNNTVALITIPWADHAFDAVFAGVSNQLALYYTERFLAWNLYPSES